MVLHELAKAGNGEQPIGPNGEVVKLLGAPVSIIHRNIRGSKREAGAIAKALKGATGISVKDINKHGIFGGPNSIFRKPFG